MHSLIYSASGNESAIKKHKTPCLHGATFYEGSQGGDRDNRQTLVNYTVRRCLCSGIMAI